MRQSADPEILPRGVRQADAQDRDLAWDYFVGMPSWAGAAISRSQMWRRTRGGTVVDDVHGVGRSQTS